MIVWIGVMPGSLSGADGVVVASKCREFLVENDITDVEVEIHESVVIRGPEITPSESSNSDMCELLVFGKKLRERRYSISFCVCA